MAKRGSVALIGSGAVATSLGLALRDAGYSIDGIVSASLQTARELAIRLDVGVSSGDFNALPETATLVFVCVPDAAIDDVARKLAATQDRWDGRLVAHTSGAVHADVLAPLERLGADILSFHPLQAFPSNGGSVSTTKSFVDIYIGLEGPDHAVVRGREIAADIGAHSIRIPSALKERYHLAASVASNLFVSVVAMANEILEIGGLNGEAGAEMFIPLIQGTLDNMKHARPERVLTGPIVRGDTLTIRKHVDALLESAPHLLPAYSALSTEAIRAAVRGGHISKEVAEDLLDTLFHGLELDRP
jgi:predicted short-subunit dehydrogenase-like oxidoreductase (DUF2520 family)